MYYRLGKLVRDVWKDETRVNGETLADEKRGIVKSDNESHWFIAVRCYKSVRRQLQTL